MIPIRKCLYQFGLCLILLHASFLHAEQDPSSDDNSKTTAPAGRSTFNSSCAGCHGLDGHGSDKAVDISANPNVQQLTDAQLSDIISSGIPEAGMPAFRSLSDKQLRAIVDYVRLLQGRVQEDSVAGNAKRGEEIFFGKGDCSSCHTISGKGGFLGPDLSGLGASASAKAMREQIIRSPRVPPSGYRTARVTTAKGDQVEGLIRNEDNFSVQLQTKDGSFHLLKKGELRSFERLNRSLMPSNYRELFSDNDLNDLVNYLIATAPIQKERAPRKKEEDEE